MTEAEIKEILSRINWDTPHNIDDIYKVFTGELDHVGGIVKNRIYYRVLNGFD